MSPTGERDEEQTPAYVPKGLTLERLLDSGVTGDADTVEPEEWEVFREGFKADRGEQAFEEFADEMWRREKKAKGLEPPPSEPQFMELMRLREWRVGESARWNPWGFVVFKSPLIDRDSAEWRKCKDRFAEILEDCVQHDRCRLYPGADECLARLQFRWIEQDELVENEGRDGGDEGTFWAVARAREKLSLPAGQDHSISLVITPASQESILQAPLPSSAKRKWRKQIPFAVAVSAKAGESPPPKKIIEGAAEEEEEEEEEEYAGQYWRGYFNVAVESLVFSVFSMVADDSRTPFEMAGHIKGQDIWCDPFRLGVHRNI